MDRRVAWLCLFAAVAMMLAGCSEASAPPAGSATDLANDLEELDLDATKTTGILRGVVVDEAIRPVAGAVVRVQVGLQAFTMNTTASGLFGFDDLPPSTYLVFAEKAGFLPAQVSAVVVAGDDDPPYVRMVLGMDPAYREPYVQTIKISGFTTCTGNPVAICGLPNNYRPTACGVHELVCYDNVTNDATLFWTDFEGNVSYLQVEMAWEPSSSFSQNMAWNHVAGRGCFGVEGTNNATWGESPMIVPMAPREIRVPGGETCTVYVGISAGPPSEATCIPVMLPLFNRVCPGFAMQQSFEVFLTAFYGFLPPQDWAFVTHGEIAAP